MYRIIIAVACLGIAITTNAQTTADALRFTNTQIGGTARTVALGGAIGSIGADYSVLAVNPAGLASFRSSQLVLTPSLKYTKAISTLRASEEETPYDETKSNFNFNNLGLVFHKSPNNAKWATANWAIGFNRMANFHRSTYYIGKSKGSITDRWLEQANNGEFFPFETTLADSVSAIYQPQGSDIYFSDFNINGIDHLVEKSQSIIEKGAINEMVLSFAGNYEERLMVGMTIGVPFLSYESDKTYFEEDKNDEIETFNELTFTEFLSTKGIGINLKLGMIYRINQMFRIGVAAHSPTRYSLTDDYYNSLTYDFTFKEHDGPLDSRSPDGTFEYRLTTPWRVIGSASAIIKKMGFISAEVEWVDYSSSKFDFTVNTSSPQEQQNERNINDNISKELDQALNIRLGAEYALKKFRFRAGIALNGTPYANDNITNNTYSLGLGIRDQNYYIDFAYKLFRENEGFLPYVLDDVERTQVIDRQTNNNEYLLTFGVIF